MDDLFNEATDEQREKLWQLEDQLAGIYASTLRRAGKLAATRFKTMSLPQPVLAAGVPTPGWVPPDPEELVTRQELRDLSRKRLEHLWKRAVTLALLSYSDRFDVAFNVLNPFAAELLITIGARDSMVWDAYRDEINRTIGESYEEGKSVPDAARAIRENVTGLKNSTAKMVARTDLNALSNGASIAAASALGEQAPKYKMWVSAGDDRVRPDHVEANRQVVPTSQPFKVGVEELMFPGDPTASDSEVCNCFPADTNVLSFGEIHAATRYWYEGPLVEINTASGIKLAGTPNHPVLTFSGWKALKDLSEGDRLVRAIPVERVGAGDPNIDSVPAKIGEIYNSLSRSRESSRIGSYRVNFHGDVPTSEVEIIWTDRKLPVERMWEPTSEGVLVGACGAQSDLLSEGTNGGDGESLVSSGFGLSIGADGIGHGGGHGLTFLEAHALKPKKMGLPLSSSGDVVHIEDSFDPSASYSQRDSDRAFTFPIEVALDDVVRVEIGDAACHVYNLQTEDGWYSANSIVAHNCRCTLVYTDEHGMVASSLVTTVEETELFAAAWDESKHPRHGKGEKGGGRFRSIADVEMANPDVDLFAYENQSGIVLSNIAVAAEKQGAGVASKALDDLLEYADDTGQTVALTVGHDPERGGLSKTAKTEWYKRRGFKLNKGRNKDFAFTESMVRPAAVTAAAVDFATGSMVALYPHPDQALMLEQPDGQPADDLHITLCYLPNGWDGDKGRAMTGLVEIASVWGKLEGTVTEVSRFPEGEDGVPWIAVPNVRSLVDLREAVASVLEYAGVTVSDDYEFMPHLTLGYDVEPTRDVTGVPLTFTAISAVDGPERINIPLEPELTAAGWDEAKHPRDPGGEGGGRWVRAGDLASDDFRPEEQVTERDQLIDNFQDIQSMWDTESRGALEQYVQHEMTDEEYQSYSIQDEKAANKGVVQDRIAAKLEGDPDFLSLHKTVFAGGGGTFEDWKSEFEPGGEFPTANTPEKQVSAMMVSAWARSSSDTDPISLQLQEAANAEFGLQGATDFHVQALDEMKSLYEGSSHSPIWNEQQMAGARKFLRAQYELSQEMFQRHGISEVTLYRGMSWKPHESPIELGKVGIERVRSNPMSSYSYSFDTARGFAGKYEGSAVVGTVVDVKRVLSTPFTGAGCLSEGEFVVLGGDDSDGYMVSWKQRHMDNDTGEVIEAIGQPPADADSFDALWQSNVERAQTIDMMDKMPIEVKDA